jgi:hypothetical protein
VLAGEHQSYDVGHARQLLERPRGEQSAERVFLRRQLSFQAALPGLQVGDCIASFARACIERA